MLPSLSLGQEVRGPRLARICTEGLCSSCRPLAAWEEIRLYNTHSRASGQVQTAYLASAADREQV